MHKIRGGGGGGGDIAHSGRLRLSEKCGSESAISDRPALSRGGWVDRRGRGRDLRARYASAAVSPVRVRFFRLLRFVGLLSKRHRARNTGRREREEQKGR